MFTKYCKSKLFIIFLIALPSNSIFASEKDEDIEIKKILQEYPNSKSIELSLKNLSGEHIKHLSEFLQINKSLISLNLLVNQIDVNGAKILSDYLINSLTLTTLNLFYNQIGDVGVEYISQALQKNSSLINLNLQSNQIEVLGAKNISDALQINTILTTLNLVSNQLGVEGTKYISDALRTNTSLTHLWLSKPNVYYRLYNEIKQLHTKIKQYLLRNKLIKLLDSLNNQINELPSDFTLNDFIESFNKIEFKDISNESKIIVISSILKELINKNYHSNIIYYFFDLIDYSFANYQEIKFLAATHIYCKKSENEHYLDTIKRYEMVIKILLNVRNESPDNSFIKNVISSFYNNSKIADAPEALINIPSNNYDYLNNLIEYIKSNNIVTDEILLDNLEISNDSIFELIKIICLHKK
jgi:hypothetical protein